MIFPNLEEIVELIENPANKILIKDARIYSDKCHLHVNGKNIDKFFQQIKGYENSDQLKLRQDYARSNKYIFEEMLRPLDKIYAARGGAKYYNIGGSDYSDETKFKQILSNVKNGMSLEKWNQKIWLKKRITDPNGIIMIEVSENGRDCYPTYKSIFSIKDYKFNGLKVEYIIFEPELLKDGVNRYRVVDDVMDYIIVDSGEIVNSTTVKSYSIVEDESFRHGFSGVPAIMISDTEDEVTGIKTSFIDNVIELAEEILVDNSVKIIFKFTQGFPAYWEIERVCPQCKGEKNVSGEECPSCHGIGIRQKRDVSDKIIITMDETGKAGAIPPAGYVSADTDTWSQMNAEGEMMTKLLHKSMWGTMALTSEKVYEKATGVLSDLQPAYDRLNVVSNEAENMEKFQTDLMGTFYFRNAYKGCTIIYGKRFQIESPDQLLKKLTEAKQGQIPAQTVTNMYMEYLQTMYSNDLYEMSRQIKIFKLDVYPLYTSMEIKELGLSVIDVYRKILFDQWVNLLSIDEIFFTPIEELISKRDSFIKSKIKEYEVLQRSSNDLSVSQREAV